MAKEKPMPDKPDPFDIAGADQRDADYLEKLIEAGGDPRKVGKAANKD